VLINFLTDKSLMKYPLLQFVSYKIIMLLFCSGLLISSCLKSKDDTGNGAKSQLSITNYVVNGSLGIMFDNSALTMAPIGYGNGIATGTGGYASLGSGLHNMKLATGVSLISDNTISLTPAYNYSLFYYDTLKNNKVRSLLLTDDLTTIDTVGRARFLQFIPGADSLTLYISKDTLTYSIRDTYVGNKTVKVDPVAFSVSLKPTLYKVMLQRKGVTIVQDTITVQAGKIYSFIAKGVIGGAGVYKESVTVVHHN